MPPASRGWNFLTLTWRQSYSFPRIVRYATTVAPIPPAPLKIRLRQYQEECIQAVLASIEEGRKRLGVSLATGSGKTVIFTQLIDRVKRRNKDADQTLILAHRSELVEQAARHCMNAYPSKRVEIEMAANKASGYADITVASIQSLMSGDRITKFNPHRFKLILVDEAHHIVAPNYMRALQYFGLDKAHPENSPALVGVSATMSRFDGLKLGTAIDQIVYHKDYIDMIEEKWLSNVVFTTVHTKVDLSSVKNGANGDFQPKELSDKVNIDSVNDITVKSWLAKSQGRKSTLVFCCDLAHVDGLTNEFRKHGIDAQFVTGNTPKPERSARLDAFKRGEFPVLVNCGVFTEGTDIPNIDCVLMARPTKSRNLLVQMIGRGMRLHPGKENCHIIDMVASLSTGIISTPTLFGLDPKEIVEEASPSDMHKLQQRMKEETDGENSGEPTKSKQPARNISNTVTFTDYDSIYDLIGDTSGDRHIRQMSSFAWVSVTPDKFILTNSNGSYLRLERDRDVATDEDMFLVTETAAIPSAFTVNSPFRKPREIVRAATIEAAVRAADTYATKKYPLPVILRRAQWRTRPATEGQIAFLNKIRPQNAQLTVSELTKGAAGDMITKLKHGARGRFADLAAARKKQSRAKEKLEQQQALKDREKVTVGPMLN
ncbi:P-loop containing nucleoside triphosphate hydrolase [Glarea lozoyensis ATCC 20868]|uniref:p-loop containing nucleoside triphosphate hydrolase n=2 Tax=Glarea lozoyensis TaxID=101852 RepID=S3CXL2_GLAL2|nr:P-loop containing nucleoside triphosphate hydrolase [Glarea lozoyensis ATCC 20868]EHL02943.1 putative mitochondrial ATP-dependent helicase irc3 [Glarea lozoyensis 74030]EPE31082.1 P-loop containing nucleoside triphosphate hydrolase [Glarea lozoyensis ATCC 20868]